MYPRAVLLSLAAILLAACQDREVLLPGPRLDIRTPVAEGQDFDPSRAAAIDRQSDLIAVGSLAGQPTQIALPSPRVNAAWTHAGGTPTQRISHPALTPVTGRVWVTEIGEGESRRNRITTRPVTDGARIYTLDAGATVQATTTAGQRVWAVDLTPSGDSSDEASGGGLATANGRVYVTSVFGTLSALDAATGALIWQQDLGAAAVGAPTVSQGTVYLVARDNQAWALDEETGRIRWQLTGLPSTSGFAGGSSVAVDNRIAVFPYSSGEVIATFRQGGLRLWGGAVQGERLGQAYARIGDISAGPVIDGSRVFAGNASGRLVALDAADGRRQWTAEVGAYEPVWPVGGSLFAVTDRGALVRINAQTGETIWRYQLPYFEDIRQRRREAVVSHHGPVLAGGLLYVASGDGVLRMFDPVSGQLQRQIPLPGGAAAAPIVAGGTLYVVTTDGKLHAFR